jgi:hypothetical protein
VSLPTRVRRVACSMTASMYILVPARVTVSKKSHASSPRPRCAGKPPRSYGRAPGRGPVAGVAQDLPHRGGGDLDLEGQQLAVNAPVAPRRVLPPPAASPAAAPSVRSGAGRAASVGTGWRGGGRAGHGASAGSCPDAPAAAVPAAPVPAGGAAAPPVTPGLRAGTGAAAGRVGAAGRRSGGAMRESRVWTSLTCSLIGSSHAKASTLVTAR